MSTSFRKHFSISRVMGVALLVLCSCIPFAQHAYAEDENLTVTEVEVVNIDDIEKTATVVWKTNEFAQSWVVCGNYSKAPFTFGQHTMTFGYTWGTILMEGLKKEHEVPLTELASGAHFCRVASRTYVGSPWIVSDEVVFTVDDNNAPSEGKLGVVQATETEKGEENEPNTDVSSGTEEVGSPLGSLFDSRNSDTCKDEWAVWVVVFLALMAATFWSKEMRANLSTQDTVKRLYMLTGVGVIIFFIAIMNDVAEWVVPIGIGTIAIIVATITDVIRSVDGVKADQRLERVTRALYITLWVAVLFALMFTWTCSVVPLIAIALVLMFLDWKAKKEE